MSDLMNLLTNDDNVRRRTLDAESGGGLFAGASWDQIGADKELTNFLHGTIDPNGSKFGGNSEAMKTFIQNDITENNSSILLSIRDFAAGRTEGVQDRQFKNLIGRLYEQSPNRLMSGNAGDTYQALKSGVVGAVGYDAPLLALNIIAKPLLVGTGLIKAGLGARGALQAGVAPASALAGEELAKLIATGASETAVQAALDASGVQVAKGLGKAGFWQGAKHEAGVNAAEGAFGDVLQQDAAVQRELQKDISWAGVAGNAAGGALLGGALGGAAGVFDGRSVAKGVRAGIERDATDVQIRGDEELNSMITKAPDAGPEDGFVALDNAHINARSNLVSTAGEVEQFMNGVIAGHGKSRYTPEQLEALRSALADKAGAGRLSESLVNEANALEATGKPENIKLAQQKRQQAANYESFIKHLDTLDLSESGAIMAGSDISESIMRGVAEYDTKLATALGKVDAPPAAPKAAKTAAAPAAPAAATPAAGSPDEPQAKAAAATEELKAATPAAPEAAPTASDISAMAETLFSADEKQALAATLEAATKGGTTMDSVLAKMSESDIGTAAQTLADASPGSDVGAIKSNLEKVAAASMREHAKAQAAAPAPTTPTAAAATPESDVKLAESAGASVDEKIVANADLTDKIAAELSGLEAAKEAAAKSHAEIVKAADDAAESVSKVLDGALAKIAELKNTPDLNKVELVKEAMAQAIESNPDLKPLLARLDPAKMTSAKGVENAKTLLNQMAAESVAFTYAKVVGDVLPDALNAEHFGTVLRSMLDGVPSEKVEYIVNSYKAMVYNALVDRVRAIGVSAVEKDAALGSAWKRLIDGRGGEQMLGGKTKTTADIGKIIKDQAAQITSSVKGMADLTTEQLAKAGGVVRDFKKQLETAGIPMDSQFMHDSLAAKAISAVRDVAEDTFRVENKEAFDKIAAMNALRDGGVDLSRNPANERNPFFGGMQENPVLHRVKSVDEDGNDVYTDVIASGRQQTRDKNGKLVVGKPQGILSDGISNYLGLLWSSPRKMFASVSAARRAILGAAVDNASWSRGSMMINGEKFSGPMKELKGLYKETAIANAEKRRFGLLMDAVERLSKDEGAPGYLSMDAFKERIALIGSRDRVVSADELAVAGRFIEHKKALATNTAVVQAEMREILEQAGELGIKGSDQINALVAKLNDFKARNDKTLLTAVDSYTTKAKAASEVRGKSGENANKGSAETMTTQQKLAADQAKATSLTVNKDGSVAYAVRDANPVVVKVGGVGYEVTPRLALSLDKDGNVMLFGEKIGIWHKGTKGERSVIVNVPGLMGEEIGDLTALVNRKKFVNQFSEKFAANTSKMTKAADAAVEGAQIDKSLSQTAKVETATKELLNHADVREADMSRTVSSFETPADRVIVFRDKKTGYILKPGATQRELSVTEVLRLKGWSADHVEMGTVPSGRMTKAGKAQGMTAQEYMQAPGSFVAMGRDTGSVDHVLVKAVAAKMENRIPMLRAQKAPVSMKDAAKIKVDGERTLADMINEFDAATSGLKWGSIPDLDTLNTVVAGMKRQAEYIESIAPHGVIRDNASRRTSFHFLEQHLSGYNKGELSASLDILRRLDAGAGQMPYFRSSGTEAFGNSFDGKSITLGGAGGGVPKHIAVTHELGHWAFMNMLTPSERVEFVQSLAQHYGTDGSLSKNSVLNSMGNAKAIQDALGKDIKGVLTDTNELFAWQFTNWGLDTMVGKAGAEAELSLWGKVTTAIKELLAHFLGQKTDPKLVPLFERILPSKVSESKFDYSQLYDRNTGKLVSLGDIEQAGREKVGLVTDIMQKVDTLRSKLGQQLFTPGGAVDGGFIGDLEAATKHMFGLLNGRDVGEYSASKTVTDLRKKLNPTRGGATLPGAVDPRELFSRNETGKLMQAIRDVMPEGMGDNVAFEAAAGAEEFSLTMKATAQRDMPDVEFTYNQALEQEFNRKVSAGMKPEDALDHADIFAAKQAADYAMDTYQIDLGSSMFDESGARVKLGSADQQKALGSFARRLYDLMSDSLDHLENDVHSHGFGLKRTSREVAAVEPTAAEHKVEQQVAAAVSAKGTKKTRAKAEPSTQSSAAVVAREESERVDGVATGVPAAAPESWRALISRVSHRDADQQDVIGSMMYRVFSHVFGDKVDMLTNADISRLSGLRGKAALGEHAAKAQASSGTPAFEALRSRFRHASEELTNGNKNAQGSMDFVIELLSNGAEKDINDRLGMDRFDVTGKLADHGKPAFTSADIATVVKAMSHGSELDSKAANYLMGDQGLAEILSNAQDILKDLAKSANAKRTIGNATVETAGKPIAVMLQDGQLYHPLFAKKAVETRLMSLPKSILDQLVVTMRMGSGAKLADSVGFVSTSSRHVHLTTKSVMGQVNMEHRFQTIDGEIASALTARDSDAVLRLARKRDELAKATNGTDGVRPVFVDKSRLYDSSDVSELGRMKTADIQALVEAGGKLNDVLKAKGYTGVIDGDMATLFKSSSAVDVEKRISEVLGFKRNTDAGDVPFTGEILLNFSLEEGVSVNRLAIEQRALQAGAPSSIAKVMADVTGKDRRAGGLTDDQSMSVRKFAGIQLSTNAVRIFNAGGKFLANIIAPVDGAGFQDSLSVKLSSDLSPVLAQLDKLTGLDNWIKKSANEIYRSLDMRKKAVPQSVSELSIAMAMRENDISKLGMPERKFVAELNSHFEKLLRMQRDAGLDVGDVTIRSGGMYLPQRFNLTWINANKDEAVNLLATYFHKDRGSVDLALAKADARKVIMEAVNKDELQGIIDGASTVYTQAFGDKLHSRKLNIVGKDWQAMAPMFDNNLRSLVTSYTEAAHKRVEWTTKFGVKGHGAALYVNIAERGHIEARKGLMNGATGLTKVISHLDEAGDMHLPFDREVEAVSELFTPFTRSDQEAAAITADIVTLLGRDDSAPAQALVVEALVNQFTQSGGAGAKHFKKHAEFLVAALADFGDEGKTVANSETEFMRSMVGVLGGRPAHTTLANSGLREVARGVKTFNSITLLSGAVLGSLADPALSLIRAGSVQSWLKGTSSAVKKAMGDPANVEAMMRVGVGLESLLNENITHVNGGAMGRITTAFFHANMLTPWTEANRQAAAFVGFESIKASQMIVQREKFNGNIDTHAYRRSIRYLRELGVAHLAESGKLDKFADGVTSDIKLAEAIHKFTNEAVFQPNRNDVPLWAQDPIAGILWQFKSFPMMMGRLVKRNLKTAMSFEGGSIVGKLKGESVGKYDGDPMGLMYLLTVGSAAGAGSVYAKDVLLGKNQDADPGNPSNDWRSPRERTLSKVLEEFGIEAEIDSPEADLFFGSYLQGLLSIGALGFLGDLMYQSAKSVDDGAFGQMRILSQIAGPALGTLTDSIQLVDGGLAALKHEEGDSNSKQRTAVRKVLKRVPFVGGQDPLVEDWVNTFAGEAETPPEQK